MSTCGSGENGVQTSLGKTPSSVLGEVCACGVCLCTSQPISHLVSRPVCPSLCMCLSVFLPGCLCLYAVCVCVCVCVCVRARACLMCGRAVCAWRGRRSQWVSGSALLLIPTLPPRGVVVHVEGRGAHIDDTHTRTHAQTRTHKHARTHAHLAAQSMWRRGTY